MSPLPGQIQNTPPFAPQVSYQKDLVTGRPGELLSNQDQFRSILSMVASSLIPFGRFVVFDPALVPPASQAAQDVSALIPCKLPTSAVQITGAAEVQTVTPSAVPASGSAVFNYKGAASAAINWNDSAATIQAKLQALATIGSGNLTVTGTLATALTLTFAGALANAPQALFTFSANSLLDGGAAPVTLTALETVAGSRSVGLGVTLMTQSKESGYDTNPPSYPAGFAINGTHNTDVYVQTEQKCVKSDSVYVRVTAVSAKNEVQVFSAQDSAAAMQTPDAGSFNLVWNNQMTSKLAFGAVAADIQTALNLLPGITPNGVTVAGNWAAGFTITFLNALAALPQSFITVQNNSLAKSGVGLNPTVTQTTQGIPAGNNLGAFRKDADSATAALLTNARFGTSSFDAFTLQWITPLHLTFV